MSQIMNRRFFVGCAICAATAELVASNVLAQPPASSNGLTRTMLQKTEYPGDKHVTMLMMVEIAPNFMVPRHTHPGVESTYVIEGGGTLSVKGATDRMLKTGDGFQVPPETPHALKNGPAATRLAITYVVEKDRPLATPVLE